MGMGSSRPNCVRRLARTSAGTFGLVASSSKGSPGANASTVKRTRLMPSRAGIVIRRRRRKYLDIARRGRGGEPDPRARLPGAFLGLAVPIVDVPEVGVPAALLDAHGVGYGGDPRAEHHRDDHDVLDDQLVHLDEEGGPLDRVKLALGRAVELVVLLALPTGDIAALPLVLLGGDLPRR